MGDRRHQVHVLRGQALRALKRLEGEVTTLAGEAQRLREARAELPARATVASTAGLAGNAQRHHDIIEGRRASLAEQVAAAEARLQESQADLRQARRSLEGWERLAERLAARERQRVARQEQELIDQHGQRPAEGSN